MIVVEMPKVNENMAEATLDRWLVKEGEAVAKDQPLCMLITDKASGELPAPAKGKVLQILALERAVLPVGYSLCVIGGEAEAPPAGLKGKNEALLAAHLGAATTAGSLNVSQAPILSGGPAVRATPAARRLAREAGADLAAISKKFKLAGPVAEKDVKRFLEGG
jgi:pyruvate dehydrogenase E2 component (dihydrolipoamide acetyltransferase)